MILVTGAGGHLGRAVVRHLVERVEPGRIVAGTRDPDDLSLSADIGVRRVDFADPKGLTSAFEDADRILLVSVGKLGEEARRLHGNAAKAAREAGVERLFYTSHAGARQGSLFPPANQHAATEADLAASGMSFTALRHGFYAESCLQLIGDGLKAGELRVPEDGPVAWTARDDLAEADAALLAGERTFDGPTPALTAARALTMAEIADLASEVAGREVRHTVVSDAEWKDARIATGVPEPYADLLLGTFRAARLGDFAATDPTLGHLLGREPRTMREMLAAALAPSRQDS